MTVVAADEYGSSGFVSQRPWLYIANTSRPCLMFRGADTKASRYTSLCTPTAQTFVAVSSCSNCHWSVVLIPRRLRIYGSRCLARNIPTPHTDLDKTWMRALLPIISIGVHHHPDVMVEPDYLVGVEPLACLDHTASEESWMLPAKA
jgi:hypothetical protein